MREYKLSDPDYAYISINSDAPVHRFAVQSRGGYSKYDVFCTLDDAIQYIFSNLREDLLFINYVEIMDMRTGLVLSFDNLKWFSRKFSGLEH